MILGDRDKAREEQDHAVARIFPQVQGDHYPEGRLGVEPVCYGQPQSVQPFVYKPRLGKQQLHQQHRAHHGHNVGQQQDGFQCLMLPRVAFQQQRDGVGQENNQGKGHNQEFQRIAEGQPEHAAVQHTPVGLNADVFPGSARAPLEGILQHHQKGDRVK